MRRPTCPPALTPGQTSPRSSGTSSPPHHSCPHVLTSLFSTHALVSAQEERSRTSKCNRPPPPASPMPESTLVWVWPSPPLLADCALRQAAAARCQDLFRERAGGGWVGRGGGGVRAHTGASGENQPSLHPDSPQQPCSCTCLLILSILNLPWDSRKPCHGQF